MWRGFRITFLLLRVWKLIITINPHEDHPKAEKLELPLWLKLKQMHSAVQSLLGGLVFTCDFSMFSSRATRQSVGFSVQPLYYAHIKKPGSLVPAIKPIISYFASIKLCVWNSTYQTHVLVGPPLNEMFLCFIKAHTTNFLTAQAVHFVYYI